MRRITVTVGQHGDAWADQKQKLGFSGEHNAVQIVFSFKDEAFLHFCGAEYYRVSIDGNYSEKLYLQDGEVSYTVPQSVMNSPSVNCQLIGYIEEAGSLSLIAKSSVVELLVDFSETPKSKIGQDNDVLENAIALCSNAAEKTAFDAEFVSQRTEQVINVAHSVESNVANARQYSVSAKASANEAKGWATKAETSATESLSYSLDARQTAESLGDVADCVFARKSGQDIIIDDISPIPHNIKVKLSGENRLLATVYKTGKNLLIYPYTQVNYTSNGISFTANTDGSVTLNGQNNGEGASMFYFFKSGSTNIVTSLDRGVYIGSIKPSISGVAIGAVTESDVNINFSNCKALVDDTIFKSLYLGVERNNQTYFDNVTIYPMIERGFNPTAYEPYVVPQSFQPDENGNIEVPSLCPTTRLHVKINGVNIEAYYHRKTNKVLEELVLKGVASGNNVLLTDIAETEHDIKVTLSGDGCDTATLYQSGKNLFDASVVKNYNNKGIKVDYIPKSDCFVINGISTGEDYTRYEINIPYKSGKTYFATAEVLGGSVYVPTGKNSYCMFGNEKNNSLKNLINLSLRNSTKTASATITDHVLNRVWFYIGAGVEFKNYIVRIQLEEDTATEHQKYIEPIAINPNSDGSFTVPSLYPATKLYTDKEDVVITAEYNRDLSKVIGNLTNAIISLGGNV